MIKNIFKLGILFSLLLFISSIISIRAESSAFVEEDVLPETEFLKISWTSSTPSAMATSSPAVVIYTDSGSKVLIHTAEVPIFPFDTYYEVQVNGIGIAYYDTSTATGGWLSNCGSEGTSSCGTQKFVVINTMDWSEDERTLSYVSTAVNTYGFSYEDIDDRVIIDFTADNGYFTFPELSESLNFDFRHNLLEWDSSNLTNVHINDKGHFQGGMSSFSTATAYQLQSDLLLEESEHYLIGFHFYNTEDFINWEIVLQTTTATTILKNQGFLEGDGFISGHFVVPSDMVSIGIKAGSGSERDFILKSITVFKSESLIDIGVIQGNTNNAIYNSFESQWGTNSYSIYQLPTGTPNIVSNPVFLDDYTLYGWHTDVEMSSSRVRPTHITLTGPKSYYASNMELGDNYEFIIYEDFIYASEGVLTSFSPTATDKRYSTDIIQVGPSYYYNLEVNPEYISSYYSFIVTGHAWDINDVYLGNETAFGAYTVDSVGELFIKIDFSGKSFKDNINKIAFTLRGYDNSLGSPIPYMPLEAVTLDGDRLQNLQVAYNGGDAIFEFDEINDSLNYNFNSGLDYWNTNNLSGVHINLDGFLEGTASSFTNASIFQNQSDLNLEVGELYYINFDVYNTEETTQWELRANTVGGTEILYTSYLGLGDNSISSHYVIPSNLVSIELRSNSETGHTTILKSASYISLTILQSEKIIQGDTNNELRDSFLTQWRTNEYTQNYNQYELVLIPYMPTHPFGPSAYFEGWFTDNEVWNEEWDFLTNYLVYDATLYAYWNISEYTVDFETNGAPLIDTQYITHGNLIVEPIEPIIVGYTFLGWYDNPSFTGAPWDFDTQEVFDNMVLYASWEIIDYTVTYYLDGGINHINNPISFVIDNLPINLGVPTKLQHEFNGWYEDALFTLPISELDENKDYDLYASWTLKDYSITYNLLGGINHPDNSGGFNSGDLPLILHNPSRAGYVFDGWYDNNEYLGSLITEIPVGTAMDVTLYAKWEMETFSITYNLNGGVNHPSNPPNFTDGDIPLELFNPTRLGYDFLGWYDNSSFTGTSITHLTIPEDIILYAKWEYTNYTITYNLDGGTNHPSNPTTYTIADPNITLMNASRDGYFFEGWYNNPSFIGSEITVIDTSLATNLTLYAKWDSIEFYNYIEEEYYVTYPTPNFYGYSWTSSNDNTVRNFLPDGTLNWTYYGHGISSVTKIMVDDDGYSYSISAPNKLHKVSPSGTNVWIYNAPHNILDMFVDKDGFIYLSMSPQRGIIKLSPDAIVEWHLTDLGFNIDRFIVHDGYLYITQNVFPNYRVLKMSDTGDIIWTGSEHTASINSINVSKDGNYLVTTSNDYTARKWDIDGNLLWTHTHTGVTYKGAFDVNNNVLIAGRTSVIKLNALGVHQWTYNGIGAEMSFRDISIDNDGYAYAVSAHNVPSGTTPVYNGIYKLSPSGALVWQSFDNELWTMSVSITPTLDIIQDPTFILDPVFEIDYVTLNGIEVPYELIGNEITINPDLGLTLEYGDIIEIAYYAYISPEMLVYDYERFTPVFHYMNQSILIHFTKEGDPFRPLIQLQLRRLDESGSYVGGFINLPIPATGIIDYTLTTSNSIGQAYEIYDVTNDEALFRGFIAPQPSSLFDDIDDTVAIGSIAYQVAYGNYDNLLSRWFLHQVKDHTLSMQSDWFLIHYRLNVNNSISIINFVTQELLFELDVDASGLPSNGFIILSGNGVVPDFLTGEDLPYDMITLSNGVYMPLTTGVSTRLGESPLLYTTTDADYIWDMDLNRPILKNGQRQTIFIDTYNGAFLQPYNDYLITDFLTSTLIALIDFTGSHTEVYIVNNPIASIGTVRLDIGTNGVETIHGAMYNTFRYEINLTYEITEGLGFKGIIDAGLDKIGFNSPLFKNLLVILILVSVFIVLYIKKVPIWVIILISYILLSISFLLDIIQAWILLVALMGAFGYLVTVFFKGRKE